MGAGVATNPHCPGSDLPGSRGALFLFAGAGFPPRHCCRVGFPVPVPAEASLPRSVPVRVLSFALRLRVGALRVSSWHFCFGEIPVRIAFEISLPLIASRSSRLWNIAVPPGPLQAAIKASFDRNPFGLPSKAMPWRISLSRSPASALRLRILSLRRSEGSAGPPFGKWVRPWLSPLPRASSSWLALPSSIDAPLILSDIRRLCRRGNVLEPSSVFGFRRSRSAAPGHICKLTGRSASRQHKQPVDK